MNPRPISFALLGLVLLVGCGENRIDKKLNELEQKPAATTVADAKKLYEEAKNLVRWHEDPKHELMTAAQKTRAETLVAKRRDEGLALLADKAKEGVGVITSALGNLGLTGLTGRDGSINPKKAIEWFLGTNDPRREDFGCVLPEGVKITDEGVSKYCP